MKTPCDCDKPAGAPADSIRNAAALWTSAGRVLGYAEATDFAATYVGGSASGIIDAAQANLSNKQKAKLVAALQAAAQAIRAGQDGRRAEAEVLKKTALTMVERLEQRKARGFLHRARAALVALRA